MSLTLFLFLHTCPVYSMAWTWRVVMPAVRRHCSLPGEQEVRNALTSSSNMAALQIPAARQHRPARGTTPTPTTTTDSARWTAALASCRFETPCCKPSVSQCHDTVTSFPAFSHFHTNATIHVCVVKIFSSCCSIVSSQCVNANVPGSPKFPKSLDIFYGCAAL